MRVGNRTRTRPPPWKVGVAARMRSPLASRRATAVASKGGRNSSKMNEFAVVRIPAV